MNFRRGVTMTDARRWLALVGSIVLLAVGVGCESPSPAKSTETAEQSGPSEQTATPSNPVGDPEDPWRPEDLKEGQAVATFAGGCFWCMEPPFDEIEGVEVTIVGYTGGPEENPTYKQVAYGRTGHTESIQVRYDPEVVDYETLLAVFWRNIDPTAEDRQFVDVGSQYRSAIFYHNDRQRRLAEKSKRAVAESGRFDEPIVTPVQPASRFWRAEDYHQNYYKKSTRDYKQYRNGSGRDPFIQKYWGDMPSSIEELRSGHRQ
jgi:methionine-S-sulfoxide reductase